jgi:hypothetical protein
VDEHETAPETLLSRLLSISVIFIIKLLNTPAYKYTCSPFFLVTQNHTLHCVMLHISIQTQIHH